MSEFHERFPPAHPPARIPQAVAEGLLCASLCVRTRTSQTAVLMRLKVVLKNRIVESTRTGTVGVPRENKRPRVRIYSESVD